MKIVISAACSLTLLVTNLTSLLAVEPEWAVPTRYRIIATLPARSLPRGRSVDELPAELQIDFTQLAPNITPNIASLHVTQYDPTTGKAITSDRYAYATSAFDVPFRWLDDAIPYEFPEFLGAITRTSGKIVRRPRTRGGYFFNAIGDWKSGHLTWLHKQTRIQDSFYAIYFDELENAAIPTEVPPRAWIGDGLPRCDVNGTSTMGADHCRMEFDDWNDDGLIDIIVGENYGHVFWWPNCGTPDEPKFPYCKFVVDADDLPLDAGMIAAPKVVDWNNDGLKDLLVGTEWNRILYFANVGTNANRHLQYAGYVTINDEPLELPIRPMTRGDEGIFKRDYYPMLEVADWDQDGDMDLFTGGYITGQIFYYENVGTRENGTPRLAFRHALSSGGEPINVRHWCASPCLADLDNDGDLDLLSGNMPMYETAEERVKNKNDTLVYYENIGSANVANFQMRSLPSIGKMPSVRLATPRVADWDSDGDLDLAISARENIFLFENEGTKQSPRFALHSNPLPSHWGMATLAVDQFIDWNDDGREDLVNNYQVRLKEGTGNPYRWSESTSILTSGDYIAHPSGIGDDWFWPYLRDFDQDEHVDVLFGDWHGNIWFHKNEPHGDLRRFDLVGKKLLLDDGKQLKVGPIDVDPSENFAALQGARTVFTVADFNRDELLDLVVGDTFGKVRYFENVGTSISPRFAQPIEIGDLGIRLLVDATDWNGDGWPDVVAGAANGKVRIFTNRGTTEPVTFADGVDPKLPVISQPRVMMVDINDDGDEDLFLPSTQGSCFVERSFLENGYLKAELVGFETRDRVE